MKRRSPAAVSWCSPLILAILSCWLRAHALHGHQISLVHHTQRFLAGDALMTFVRERAGVEIIRKHAAARAVLRACATVRWSGIPFDQNAKRSEAVFVPFFGELAATTSGLARLARSPGPPSLQCTSCATPTVARIES